MEKVKYMKRIDFENGTITNNILNAAIPMLVAQILSLLYNIVDRVYIARIPDVGTNALGWTMLSNNYDYDRFQQSLWKRRCTFILN